MDLDLAIQKLVNYNKQAKKELYGGKNMKRSNMKNEKPTTLKRKLSAAVAMLLIASLLMSTATFAWFVLSTAPEVTGIETKVGANGSLEIALLNTQTRADMSTIRAGLGGGSLQANQVAANNAWGNLVDLGYASYGLGDLVLLPARLDATPNGDSYTVDLNKLLAVPEYGYDGRIMELSRDTASAIYKDNAFLYSGAQDYGVRAIGTSNALSPQGSALNSAKTNISTWTKSAKSGAQAAMTNNLEGLFTIIIEHTGSDKYNDAHKATVVAMLTDLKGSLDYIDGAMRQALVAYVASEISNEGTFTAARDRILDTATPLSNLLSEAEQVHEKFSVWVTDLEAMQAKWNAAKVACDALDDNDYTWEELKSVLANVLNVETLLINGKTIENLDINGLMNASLIEMILAPGSGLFADIADFTDNYVVSSTYAGKSVEVATASVADPKYLPALAVAVNTLTPADGGEEASALPLTATYGYAIDLAFRCNAAQPDLVLQTKGVQRAYNGGENADDVTADNANTQGGGSYMEFSSKDNEFTLEQRLVLMDALRVGFVDDQGAILGIAKLDVNNHDVTNESVKAPLYMYDYTFEADENSDGLMLTMGARRLTDNLITLLQQNVAKAVTVVVWLDGDIVDNTMVSATNATSLDGSLNLQFATSAELVPAQENSLLNYSVDKAGLEAAMVAANEYVVAGQGKYTNVSWNAFMAAFRRAEDVSDDPAASQIAIRNALTNLVKTQGQLMEVSNAALNTKVLEIRKFMGETTDVVGYIVDMAVDGYVAMLEGTKTQEETWKTENEGEIFSVDNEKNLNNEGNDIYTAIYTETTWNALANALYQAEAVVANEDATDDQLNGALSALDEAQKALQFAVVYVPYEYNGDLYYMARSEADAEDTYGRWYDANFKRITADVTILKLNAYAKQVEIAQLDTQTTVTSDVEYITPDISFIHEVFPELRDVQVKGAHWDVIDEEFFTEMMGSGLYNRLNKLVAMVEADEALTGVDTATAEALLADYEADAEVTAEAASQMIETLTQAIVDAYAAKLKADDAPMTDNLRMMLTAAVNAAKAVEGYEEDDLLKGTAEDAEALLAEDATPTNSEAALALEAVNDLLTDKITEENTIVYKLYTGDEDLVYEANYPGAKLKLTGKTGETTIGVTVLTEDGVVVKLSKNIKICEKAEEAQLDASELNLTVEGALNVKVSLIFADNEAANKEKAIKYTWATSNNKIATVSGDETATVTGVAAGEVEISVSVETECGNTYVAKLNATVQE